MQEGHNLGLLHCLFGEASSSSDLFILFEKLVLLEMAYMVHLGGISLRKPGELGIVFILKTQIQEEEI